MQENKSIWEWLIDYRDKNSEKISNGLKMLEFSDTAINEPTLKKYELMTTITKRIIADSSYTDLYSEIKTEDYETEESRKLIDFISNTEKVFVSRMPIFKHKGHTLSVGESYTTVDDFIKMVDESEETDTIVYFFSLKGDKLIIRFAQKSFKVKPENKNYYPKHDFEFKVDKIMFINDKNTHMFKRVTFDVCVEMLQDGAVTEDEYTEIIAEKLKQDFKKLIYEKLTNK